MLPTDHRDRLGGAPRLGFDQVMDPRAVGEGGGTVVAVDEQAAACVTGAPTATCRRPDVACSAHMTPLVQVNAVSHGSRSPRPPVGVLSVGSDGDGELREAEQRVVRNRGQKAFEVGDDLRRGVPVEVVAVIEELAPQGRAIIVEPELERLGDFR